MNIRCSHIRDLPDLMDIFGEAQKTMAALGIDQWQNGYPSEAVIQEDIVKGRSYVVEHENEVLGTFVLVHAEPTYDRIYEGQWTEDDYVAIHRVAVKVAFRGQGITDSIVGYATEYARCAGRHAIRIDTHQGNIPMRRMLKKQGFQYCGVIFLMDGSHRVAYEKRI